MGRAVAKGFLPADRSEFVAMGFDEPVRVFEIRASSLTTYIEVESIHDQVGLQSSMMV
ncbi:MAG: hypothetical protein Q7T82_08000 [Armatimonadota bacterium]|nr:hypothetical protein [Armatimonadota bacterium]